MAARMFTLVEGFEGDSMAIEVTGEYEISTLFPYSGRKVLTTEKPKKINYSRPSFTLKFYVPLETKMSFMYMIRAPHRYEYYYLFVDNIRKLYGDGSVAWRKYEQILSPGEHTITCQYEYRNDTSIHNTYGFYFDDFTLEMFPLTNPSLIFTNEGGYPYHDTHGNIFKNLDFGTLVAGQTSLPMKVNVYNYSSFDVVKPMVYLKPPEFPPKVKLEISQYSTPFIPENELYFNGTMKDGDNHSFYVRAVSQEDTMSGGDFYIYAKAAPL
ncbi:hypothetical protein [Paenibacillus arenosi]|uniref:Uncharacterized protein n=1 Tax=Paenibacillus arenosi TaxID=2774142 RepID=A0ABR9B084_9BACL|nr:hypothetical protein [Paenibacillus arenosi]MBD8498875.1 hypothetical protein [Paenibacillus arenosi]